MALKRSTSAVLLLTFNLLFFVLASATNCNCPQPPSRNPATTLNPNLTPNPINSTPNTSPNANPTSNPNPNPTAPPPVRTCPRDTLKLGVCANVLNLVNVTIGSPPTLPCCSLLNGLVDLEAAVCLCTAIKANVLNIINLDVPVSLSLLLNVCGRNVPSGFRCA